MFYHIFLGLSTSFLGSLPLGMISIAVLEMTVNRNAMQGAIASVGVGAVEFFQALLAVTFLALFAQYPFLMNGINVISIPIFFIFAYNHFRSDGSHRAIGQHPVDEPRPDSDDVALPKRQPLFYRNSFLYGAFISSLNVVVYPFWIIAGGEFMKMGILENENFYIFSFAFGVGIGTTLGMLLYVVVGIFLQKKLQQYNLWMNRIMGTIFLALTILQIYNILI